MLAHVAAVDVAMLCQQFRMLAPSQHASRTSAVDVCAASPVMCAGSRSALCWQM
jgi:hypothetical protein